MPAQFLVNLFIAILWVLLKDEDRLYMPTIFIGYGVGIIIVFLMNRFFEGPFYLRRFYGTIKLILLFISELVQSSYFVIQYIIRPNMEMKPGIFKYETILEGEYEITALALLLTLTPGSVVMEVNPEGDTFYIHAMDLVMSKDNLIQSLSRFEKAIMEVTR